MRKLVFLFLLIANISTAQVNLNVGLKAYYPFNGNANDASGNNNNPVFNNATLTSDRLGNANSAYHFNGTSSYMRIPNSATVNFTNKMSIAAWVKVTGFYQGKCHGNRVIMKGDGDYLPGNYTLTFDDNAYTNGQNCFITAPDELHQNFYGANTIQPSGGYTPYIQKDQWYSVIITSDGTTTNLYINCQLKGSGPVGSMTFTNSYDLFFGKLNDTNYPYWFNGDLDEVRLYDRALTMDEVNVLGGCTPTVSDTIINDYAAALTFNPCHNSFTVDDATLFNTGDTVLVIQMKGAVIDSTNTAAFGTITDYKSAGNYEFNYVKSKIGNVIELKNKLLRQYDVPVGKVQLVRVPYFNNYTATKTVTCLPWDGNKGGILVLNANNSVTLNADIDVSGRGFKGGLNGNNLSNAMNCSQSGYTYSSTSLFGAPKGEGIATVSNNLIKGRGPLANGGGGGNDHNSGGAGGSNIATGGKGGYQFETCTNGIFDNGGIPGKSLQYTSNKIYMGGGGGSGHANNVEGYNPNGGNGGGIAMIICSTLNNNGFSIIANGSNASSCTPDVNNKNCNEGMGGGGAGGTILINSTNYVNAISIKANGGRGGDVNFFDPIAPPGYKHGPGGGGSGGLLWVNAGSLPSNITFNSQGGTNGVNLLYGNNAWGATTGSNGSSIFNLSIPVATTPFKPNIDSVRFTENATSCTAYDFHGLAYINTNPVSTWQWYFGDGGTANTQDASHIYGAPGVYSVKLVVTDINGCKDSIIKNLNVTPILIPALSISTPSNNICKGNTATFTATATNGGATPVYQWQKNGINVGTNSATYTDAGLNNGEIIKCTLTSSITCAVPTTAESNSITMTVSVAPANIRYPTLSSLVYQPLQLQARTFSGAGYEWKPTIGLTNPLIYNPVFSYGQQQEYKIYITTASGCVIVDTLLIKISGKKGIYVPKAFSPNGNGTNDRLYPILVGIRELYYFRIYNRWGNLLFQTNSGNPALGWDGTFRGALQPVETYTWTVEGIDVDGIIIKKSGNTLLIR